MSVSDHTMPGHGRHVRMLGAILNSNFELLERQNSICKTMSYITLTVPMGLERHGPRGDALANGQDMYPCGTESLRRLCLNARGFFWLILPIP